MHPDRQEHEQNQASGQLRTDGHRHTRAAHLDQAPLVERRQTPRVRAVAPTDTKPASLEDYDPVIGTAELDELRFLAQGLRGKAVQFVSPAISENTEAVSKRLCSFLTELDLEAHVEASDNIQSSAELGRVLEQALQGGTEQPKLKNALASHAERSRANLHAGSDFVVITDPVALAHVASRSPGQCWMWRCYLDLSRAQGSTWEWLLPLVEKYDAAIFSAQRFAPRLSIPQYLFYPTIDPLSDRNKPLEPAYLQQVWDEVGIGRSRPVVTQIASFDESSDTPGLIEAYRAAKKYVDCQLVLAGSITDDEQSEALLAKARAAAQKDSDIIVVDLPASSEMEINALQRGSTLVVHKPLRERFGVSVAEAMWKGKPVIGSAVGVIPNQIIHNITGMLVQSVEDCAHQIRYLLTHPEIAEQLGSNAREHVKENFLVTSSLKRWLLLLQTLSGVAAHS